MTRTSPATKQSDIVSLLKQMDGDPTRFDEIMTTWNTLFEQSKRNPERSFADVEAAAVLSAASLPQPGDQTSVGHQVGQLLDQFDSPAFLVRETGDVLAQNRAASQLYEIGIGASLDDLPFTLERDEQIAYAVRASLDPQKNLHDATLKRAYTDDDDRPITLSIAPSKPMVDGSGEALVFIVDARWKTEAAGLIKREFDLTDAERQLLEAFLDGQTTQEMAKMRDRSHATIRTQFHSLMSKMGARTQTELFRNALSVSQFVDKIGDIAEVLRHPYRKRVDLVRPDGRSVEITLAGDLSGIPVVYVQCAMCYTFQSHIEQAFHDAGLCVLSICRPGYGETDPGPANESIYETFAGDLEALLGQLGHERCLMMSTHTSSAFMYAAAPHLTQWLSGLMQISGIVPIKYILDPDSVIPWPKAIIRASETTPGLMNFMITAGIRAWSAMGHERFLKVQFRKSPADMDYILRPDPLRESKKAFETATKQGYGALTADTNVIFSDFSEDIRATDLPILVVHGAQDPVMTIGGVQNFLHDFGARCTSVIVPDASFSMLATHTADVVSQIETFAKANVG